MKKRIVSIITALVIWAALVPAHAENAVTFWVSDGFSSYADNASAVNDVIFDSGIDTRVINDGGEKVLYTRAFGEGISLQVQLPAANVTKSVFSARIKAKGEHVTGSLFAAVSTMEILTARKGNSEGSFARVVGGKLEEVSPAGCPEGTTITVRELFYNTPARMKFLKKDSSEAGLCEDVVRRTALARPEKCGDV